MTSETRTEKTQAARVLCPSCGKKGKPVGLITLRSLLREEYTQGLPADSDSACATDGCKPTIGSTGWRFCDAPDCEVVYFSEEGDTVFTKTQLRVPVGVKERTGDRPLCYCFGHSVASIKQELRTKGRSDALDDIRVKMKDPGCRCAVANPSGSCCLGSVARGIQIAQEELKQEGWKMREVTQPVRGNSLSPEETAVEERRHDCQTVPSQGRASQNQTGTKSALVATLGAVVTVVLGSACCWLPLLLVAFGFSAVGLGEFFEQYRPYLLSTALALLGLAWYFTYRDALARAWAQLSRKPVPVPTTETCCSSATLVGAESCCASSAPTAAASCCSPSKEGGRKQPAGQRLSMRRFNEIMLWLATVLVVLFARFPAGIGLFLSGDRSATPAAKSDVQQIVLEIQGMTCEGCARTVEKTIRGVPGVLAVSVDYEKSQAVVMLPKDAEVPRDAILEAVRRAGYSATLKQSQTVPQRARDNSDSNSR